MIFIREPIKQPHLRIVNWETTPNFNDIFSASAPYIAFSGEPVDLPKFRHFPTGMPFVQFSSHLSDRDDFIYSPFIAWGRSLSFESFLVKEYSDKPRPLSKSVAYINSNCQPHRETLFKLLRQRMGDKAVALGKCSNTEKSRAQGGYWSLKEIYQNYNFVFALENSAPPGYITEKIVNAFEAGAIPLFWGDSQTAEKFFNPRAYIDVGKFENLEQAADYITMLAASPEEIEKIRKEPIFKDGVVPDLLTINYDNPSEGAKKIIDEMVVKVRRLYFSYIRTHYKADLSSYTDNSSGDKSM